MNIRNSKLHRRAALLSVSALILGACGGGGDDDATVAEGAGSPATAAPSEGAASSDEGDDGASDTEDTEDTDVVTTEGGSVPCPEGTDDFDPDATFTWMYSVDTTSFDPDKITSNNSQMYLYPVFDSLVHINELGEPEPMLAESWELVDDGAALEMKLIEGWTFHDGEVFDAEAVKANIERSKSLAGSFNEQPLAPVTNVVAVDDVTVRFETDGAAGPLISILGSAAGMMMSPAVFDAPGQDIDPKGGSGAFEMTSYVPGDRVEYTAVADYWDPDSLKVAKLVFLISGDDNARLSAVQTGAADVTFLRASMVQPAEQAGLVICQLPSLSSYNMNINTARSEFGDPLVRQALSHAIDREVIGKELLAGLCQPSVQLFPGFYFASNPDIGADRYAYDPDRARELLAEAGLADGFSFELQVINLDVYQQIAAILQQNLADVGIDMSITPVEIQKLAEDFSVNKNVDASLSEQKAAADPSILTSEYYLADGFQNPGGYTTDEITELHAETLNGATADERASAYAELFEAVTEEAYPNITICNLTTPFVMNDTVQGVEIYADAARQFRGVSVNPAGSDG